MKRIIIFIMIIVMCMLCSCSIGYEKTYFNGAIETDSSLSKITENEAIKIAIENSNGITSKYDTCDAVYFTDGTWHVSFHDKTIACGGGIDIVVDENTMDIIDIVEQE